MDEVMKSETAKNASWFISPVSGWYPRSSDTLPLTFSSRAELTMQACPSYLTSMSGLLGQALSSSLLETSLPSATEYGDAPNAMSVLSSERAANSFTRSTISALERASMTLRPALKVAKLAMCWCVSTKLGHSALLPSSTLRQPAYCVGSSLPT